MKSILFSASLLAVASAQLSVPPGSLGNAACESDYNQMLGAFTSCGLKVTSTSITFVNGTNSATLCLCKPDNLKTLTQVQTSCSTVPSLASAVSDVDAITAKCTAVAKGSPLPAEPSGVLTAIPNGSSLPPKCEAAQNGLLTAWNQCGIKYTSAGVSVSNGQESVKCICTKLDFVASAVAACDGVSSVSSQKANLEKLRTGCATSAAASSHPRVAAMLVVALAGLVL
ncbi:hypothetical protein HDU78_007313 [Chytriomyces hyalinus]|nr:hypothetical protein HDU78_007313 [Chytriomyces hyalinus]